MRTLKSNDIYFFAGFIIILGLSGCGRENLVEEKSGEVALSELSDEAISKLALADAHDGTVDRIVEDCATCKLHMKGKAEYTALVGGYTFHLCALRCKKAIEENPERVLALLSPNKESEP